MPPTAPTGLLDDEIAQLQQEIADLEQELADLEQGVYHMRLDNGMTLQVGITGDELRFDDQDLLQALGVTGQQPVAPSLPDRDVVKNYIPYAAIGLGGLIVLVTLVVVAAQLLSPGSQRVATAPPATPTVTPTPSPTITPTPTPPLIPDDFIGRAPALLRFPSLGG